MLSCFLGPIIVLCPYFQYPPYFHSSLPGNGTWGQVDGLAGSKCFCRCFGAGPNTSMDLVLLDQISRTFRHRSNVSGHYGSGLNTKDLSVCTKCFCGHFGARGASIKDLLGVDQMSLDVLDRTKCLLSQRTQLENVIGHKGETKSMHPLIVVK